jgi:citronellyl-CoA dehydrogenase
VGSGRSGARGVSEIGAGSAVAAIKTKAVRDGDDDVINGKKTWITSGAQVDWMGMLANRIAPVRKPK